MRLSGRRIAFIFLIFLVVTPFRHHTLEATEIDEIVGRSLSLTFTDLLGSGEMTTRSDAEDRQATLLVFWSTECGPCLREIPTLNKLYAEWSPRGLEIFGISQDRRPERVIDIAQRFGITWPQYLETGEPLEKPFTAALGITGTPSFVLLDSGGTIVAAGFHNPEAVLRRFLKAGK
jgi:thiol-disulfide isomerase/thioredoxin